MTPVAMFSKRLGCTEGQVYTMLIGLVVGVLLTVTGLPAVLRTRPVAAASPVSPGPSADASAAPPTTVPGPSSLVPSDTQPVQPPSAPVVASPGISEGPAPSSAPAAVAPSPPVEGPNPVPPPGTISTFARVDHPGVPGGLATTSDGTVYVTTDNGSRHGDRGPSHVFSFDAAGNQTANRIVSGQPNGHVDGLTGAAVDPVTGSLAVLEPDSARILSLDMASGSQHLMALIPDLPACLVSLGANPCEPGAADHKPFPVAAVYDAERDLFVTDPAQDTIWRLRPGEKTPEVWYQSTDFSMGDGPSGVALSRGALEFTVGTSVHPSDLDAGGLYRVAIGADGSAGPLTLVTAFQRGDEPGPLVVGGSGTAYVVLRRTGAIVSVAPSGSVSGQLSPPGKGAVPLTTPAALALTPGRLLVANGGASDLPADWAVLAVAVEDGPAQQ